MTGTRSAGMQQQITDVLPSISVQVKASKEPHVGSVVVALDRSDTIRTIEAAMTNAPRHYI